MKKETKVKSRHVGPVKGHGMCRFGSVVFGCHSVVPCLNRCMLLDGIAGSYISLPLTSSFISFTRIALKRFFI